MAIFPNQTLVVRTGASTCLVFGCSVQHDYVYLVRSDGPPGDVYLYGHVPAYNASLFREYVPGQDKDLICDNPTAREARNEAEKKRVAMENSILDAKASGKRDDTFLTTPNALPTAGRKDDSGKLDMTLLDDMPRALAAVVQVMQWAVVDKKPVPYGRGSWLGVHPDRYRAACGRHTNDQGRQVLDNGQAPRFQLDQETKLLHQAHIACSALMALENTIREIEADHAD